MAKKGNGEGSVHKLPNGRWRAQYYVETPKGRRRRSVSAPTKQEARRLMVKGMYESEGIVEFDSTTLTVGKYLRQWLESSARSSVAPRTYANYELQVDRHLVPALGAHHRIALLASPKLTDDPEKLAHTGIHHTGFEYGSVDDLLATYERLKSQRIEPHMALDHGMTTSIYYVDPDGNSVELQSDNFGDWKKSWEWMKSSSEFADDPIGKSFDPQKMLDARREGASEEDLHRRAYAGEWDVEYDLRMPL